MFAASLLYLVTLLQIYFFWSRHVIAKYNFSWLLSKNDILARKKLAVLDNFLAVGNYYFRGTIFNNHV